MEWRLDVSSLVLWFNVACPGRLAHRFAMMVAVAVLAVGSGADAQVTSLTPAWVLQSPVTSPPAREGAAMAADSHGDLVLFGGQNSSGYLNDTWTWNGSNWTQQFPTHTPPARALAAIAYQPATGQAVLFGGSDGNDHLLGDTWTWSGTDWIQQEPANSPGTRNAASLAESSNGLLVLFGGYSAGVLSDTWTWNGTNWTQQSAASHPGARSTAAMSYSPSTHQTVLFGGLNAGGFLNDTWVWDGTKWTQEAPATSPSAREFVNMEMTYSASSGQIILLGGKGAAGDLNDTWSWNRTSWMQLSPVTNPAARHATAIAARASEVVVFGGSNGKPLDDTWILRPSTSTPNTTTAAITSSPNPSMFDQAVTFTATVTGSASAPTGSVSFLDGTSVIATEALVPGSGLSSTANFSTSSLAVGSHSITVTYAAPQPQASSAQGDTFAWTHWTAATPGDATPGSASGTLASTLYGTINVTYSGQTSGLATQPSWGPTSTFTGGIVGNAPPAHNGLALEGGYNYTETITFSHPVIDPAFAIWSLGSPYVPAYFNFTAAEPFNLLGGGPSNEYGGQSIVIAGTAIDGMEGNGIVQFIGTYSSLTFTTPDYENYYALTVGEDQTLTDNPPVSASLSQVVNRDNTTAAVTSSLSPSMLSQAVIFTAMVSGSFAAPTGSVSFLDGTSVIGTGTLTPGSGLSSTATFTTSSLVVGIHPITVVYAATQNFAAATSPGLNQAVTKDAATFGAMTFSPAATEPYGTSQIVTISDTLTYSSVRPSGAVTYVLNRVSYQATCTTTGSPETCSVAVPAATIAALPVSGYVVTGSLAADGNYSATNAVSGEFTITQAGSCKVPNSGLGSMNITYFTVAESDQDGATLPTGIFDPNYVLPALGANGLPVSNVPVAAGGPRDVLSDGEITWWSPALNNGGPGGSSDVVQTGTGVVSLPYTNNNFYVPNGTGNNDSNGFQAAALSATLTTPVAETVSFSVASDDMSFVYLDGQITCDDGGIHEATSVPCTSAVISAGSHTLKVFYVDLDPTQGILNFNVTTSNVSVGTADQLAFGTMTFSPAATEPYGTSQAITISDTLSYSGPQPTGAVTFVLNGVSYAATCTTGGSPETCVATVPAVAIAALPVKVYAVAGSFAGDCNYAVTPGASGAFTITPASTRTTLTASATSLIVGQTLTLTATVSAAAGGTPAGTITFYNGAASLGSATLNGSGVATLTLTPAVGAYVITASYGGSSTDGTSISAPPVDVTVSLANTTTALSASATTLVVGQSLTLTATVTGAEIGPTGTVTFHAGAATLGTAALNGNGMAKLTLTPALGVYSITASYLGDSNNAASTSPTVTVTVVTIGSTNLTLGASATTLTYGQTLTLTGTATGSITGHAPTGTVSFTGGGASLGTSTLNGAGIATYSYAPAVGTYLLDAAYGGDAFNGTATAKPLSVTVNPAPTTLTLTSSANPAAIGSAITFTVLVQSNAGVPAGQVTLMDGATVLSIMTLNAGTATYSTSTLALGTHSLTASYAANGNFAASQAALTQIVRNPPNFSIAPSGPLTLVTEHHGPITITVTPLNGFTGDVALSCGKLPPIAKCEWGTNLLTSTTVAVSDGPASTQLVIETSAVLGYKASADKQETDASRIWYASIGLASPILWLIYRRRSKVAGLLICLLLFTVLGLSGCATKYPDSTPVGTYTIDILGSSGNLQNTGQLTLIVTN